MSTEKQVLRRRIESHAPNESEQGESELDTKSVRKVSEPAPAKKTAIGKGDTRYWLQKGKLYADPRCRGSLSCKIQVNNRRESFPLRTANKEAGAAKAAKIYGDVSALGWDAAIAKHKPDEAPAKTATVGELIRTVQSLADVRAGTMAGNVGAFRRIVAHLSNIETTKGRTVRSENGRKSWHVLVDAVPLAKITPSAIEAWKLSYVASRGNGDEIKTRAARITVNSAIRCAKSLFAKDLLKPISASLQLPSPLPFEGVKLFPRQNMRYNRKIDAKAILAAVRDELRPTDPEAFKAAVLCLFVGLRRNEADKLRWRSIDFAQGFIQVETQTDFAAKNETSLAAVEIDADIVNILRAFREAAPNADYVLEGKAVNPKANYRTYRANATWERFIAWLRAHGVAAQKPNHELRKEAGSIICENHGLFAASRFLRHADQSTTALHYVDPRGRVTVGLGGLLTPKPENIIAPDFNATGTPAKRQRKARSA